ncbi:MAG TPA: VOC family protein [Dehalococcoidia bacterium]|nr:VOC family protein [Dehalococcoidia bacterium]
MTVSALEVFHVAIVVGDMQAAMERYSKVLAVEKWSWWDRLPPGSPARVVYGPGGGTTWELISIEKESDSQFHRFFKQHGKGVQHIGFWCPDLKQSVRAALEAGGEIVGGLTDAQGNVIVHVKPGDLDALPLKPSVFIDAGMGFTLEYFGPGSEQMYHDWFKDDYGFMLKPPPWE